MSALAGILNWDGAAADRRILDRTLERMHSRGPDATGAWTDGAIALGHRALWTTPEAKSERQPLTSPDGRVCVVADSRIDEREALERELTAGGASVRGRGDAELILHAYLVWGEDCVRHLEGDFAFAIWDGHQRRMVCATDPLGTKSIYYCILEQALRIGSDPTCFLADPSIPFEPNVQLMRLHLLNRYHAREETLLRGVMRLPPGHVLIAQDGRAHKRAYWDVRASAVQRFRSTEAAAGRFGELLDRAVRNRMRSDAAVGILLSGGIDSASVACLAARAIRGDGASPHPGVELFSLLFHGEPCDERELIDAIARATRLPSNAVEYETHARWIDPERAMDNPVVHADPGAPMMVAMLELAATKGVRVLLDGTGGDDLFIVGHGHLTDLVRRGRIGALATGLRECAAASGRSVPSLFLHHCLKPFVPHHVRSVLRRRRTPALHPASWIVASGHEAARPFDPGETPPRPSTHAQRVLYEYLRYGSGLNHALPVYEGLCGELGMELRHPFFDRRLVEFVYGLADSQRPTGGYRKALLRHAVAGVVPDPIRLRRAKAGFSGIHTRELRRHGPVWIEELIRTSVLADLGVVDRRKLLVAFRTFLCQGSIGRYDWKFGEYVKLELWSRWLTRTQRTVEEERHARA